MIPILMVIYYLPWEGSFYFSSVIFGIAAFTDWLDGFLARRWNQTTAFGAFFDPVADKIMVSIALVMLVANYSDPLMTLASAVIVCREIVISALREWMAEMGKRANVAVSYISKLKTTIQMLAILLLLGCRPGSNLASTNLASIGRAALVIAALLTLWSMYIYLKAAWPDLISKRSHKKQSK